MARIRSKDTAPELAARRAASRAGLRYRLHVRGLPGTPDLVFPGRRAVVFVHGCFWHGHGCRPGPAADWWRDKIERNRARDRRAAAALRRAGWSVLVVRECSLDADLRRVTRTLLSRAPGGPVGAPRRPPSP